MDSASAAGPNTSRPFAFPHRRWKNHPCAGVDFPDITSSTSDGRWMRLACDGLAAHLDSKIDLLAGIDIGAVHSLERLPSVQPD